MTRRGGASAGDEQVPLLCLDSIEWSKGLMRRRDFLIAGASAGVAGTLLPSLAAATAPCPPPTVAVAGGSSSTTTCDPPPPTTGMVSPAYLNSLTAFEARVLSGSLAPSNGKATMQSVTPSE